MKKIFYTAKANFGGCFLRGRAKHMGKRINKVLVAIIVTAILAGCQKNPDTPIVQNKDLENMISKAEETGEDSSKADVIIQDTTQKYENYITTITDDSFKINVNVNARVEVPDVDKLSVVRVRQKTLGDDFLSRFLNICEPDTKFAADTIYTKADYERLISVKKEEVDYLEDKKQNGEEETDDIDSRIEQANADMNSLKEGYETAPETITAEILEPHVVEPKMVDVSEELENNPDDKFYTWESDLGTTKLFRGTNSGVGGRYVTVYIQENEERGNLFRYMVSNTGEIRVDSVIGDVYEDYSVTESLAEMKQYLGLDEIKELSREAGANISVDEAKNMAQELMDKMEIADFSCDSAKLCYNRPEGLDGYRMVYVLEYNRQFDGVMVDNSGGYMESDGWTGGEYNLKTWSEEKIRVYVNDDGVVGFEYESPLELTDTVVEDSSIKSFDEIKGIFEKMITVSCAQNNNPIDVNSPKDGTYTNYNINRVVLRYTRVSEQDSFSTGLMVPVWDFIGDVEYGDYSYKVDPEKDKVVLTINAIDGTIIDRTVGY